MRVLTEVERDGTVGGDGAGESWSFQYEDDNGTVWTHYVYPVYMPERFPDWAERETASDWDVESVSMSEDDVTEYEWVTLQGAEDERAADRCAKWSAGRLRDIYKGLEV